MEIRIDPLGVATWTNGCVRCSLGRSGVRENKWEGDGATPVGWFPLRRVLYRPDRLAAPPETRLPVVALHPDDGWCDDPADALYNRPVHLPYPGGHERLWRDDHIYDVIVVLGHNDSPPIPGRGSAIFLHVARPDGKPTEGCVALRLDDLLDVLRLCGPESVLCVIPPEGPAACQKSPFPPAPA